MFSEVTGTDSAKQGFRKDPSMFPSSQGSQSVREGTLFASDLSARNSELTDSLLLISSCSVSFLLRMFTMYACSTTKATIYNRKSLIFLIFTTLPIFLNRKLVLLLLAHI